VLYRHPKTTVPRPGLLLDPAICMLLLWQGLQDATKLCGCQMLLLLLL
jgi:hypothetical protein